MSAEHPDRVKATDYKKRFGFWLAGLKCKAPGERVWLSVPFVGFFRGLRQVGLNSGSHAHSGDNLSLPSFRE